MILRPMPSLWCKINMRGRGHDRKNRGMIFTPSKVFSRIFFTTACADYFVLQSLKELKIENEINNSIRNVSLFPQAPVLTGHVFKYGAMMSLLLCFFKELLANEARKKAQLSRRKISSTITKKILLSVKIICTSHDTMACRMTGACFTASATRINCSLWSVSL